MADKPIEERIRHRRENAVDPEEFLQSVGAIQPHDGDEQLRFTPEFESRLRRHIETFDETGVDEPIIAGIFGAPEENVSIPDRPYTAFKIRHTIRNWPSERALVFDAATDAALRESTDQWDDVPPRQRYRILQSLRAFQDDCFFCSGEVAVSTEPVKSCCSDRQVLTVHCNGCEGRFLEFTAERANIGPTMFERG